ncbi:MAG: NAD(P)-dependent oxidoreductase, partial [Propionibacteriales bacterium]|nr:NAD(P)-dependent oxidoreductase [Propionibacteriales bacterium]
SGFTVVVYNRTPERAVSLLAAGASTADTPREAVNGAEIALVSLSDEAAVDALVLGPDGVASGLADNAVLIDASTVSPEHPVALARALSARGIHFVEGRVLGNPGHARSGVLRIMAGGSIEDVDAVWPLFEALGKQVHHVGPVGAAASLKLVFNLLLATQITGLAEALALAQRAGLDRSVTLRAISGSGYSSPVMSFRCGLMATRSYEPAAFRLALMAKDVQYALLKAASVGVTMPVIEASHAELASAVASGLGDKDLAAVLEVQEAAAGLTDQPNQPSQTLEVTA